MANSKRGEATIEIGGEARTIRLDFNVFAELEDLHAGEPVNSLFSKERLGIKVIRNTIFLGLREEEDRGFTPEDVGEWMSREPQRMAEWSLALKQAFVGAWGVDPGKKKRAKEEEDETKRPFDLAKTEPSTGTSSGG